jgi:hypothetical protein
MHFSSQQIPLQHSFEDVQADLSLKQLAFNTSSFGLHSTTMNDKTSEPITSNFNIFK